MWKRDDNVKPAAGAASGGVSVADQSPPAQAQPIATDTRSDAAAYPSQVIATPSIIATCRAKSERLMADIDEFEDLMRFTSASAPGPISQALGKASVDSLKQMKEKSGELAAWYLEMAKAWQADFASFEQLARARARDASINGGRK